MNPSVTNLALVIFTLLYSIISYHLPCDALLSLPLIRKSFFFTVDVRLGPSSNALSSPEYSDFKGRVMIDTGSSDFVYFRGQGRYSPLGARPNATGSLLTISDSQTTPQQHELIVDGIRVSFPNIKPVADSFSLYSTNAAAVSRLGFLNSDIPTTDYSSQNSSWPDLHDWSNIDGVFGLSYPAASRLYPKQQQLNVSTTLSTLFQSAKETRRMFTLDVRSSKWNEESSSGDYIHIGGLPSSIADKVLWSESQPFSENTLYGHSLPMFGLKLCGVDLLSNYSSHWFGIVDTGAACLTLPSFLHKMVMTWIPSECTKNATNPFCLVPNDVDVDTLPPLKFKLSENGDYLSIPLSTLTFQTDVKGVPRMAYCIRSELYKPEAKVYISFGTMILESLAITFDVDLRKVGFSQQPLSLLHDRRLIPENSGSNNTDAATDSQCAKKEYCKGDQTYYAPLNVCLDPPCEYFFFRKVDPNTKTCVYADGFEFILFIPVLVCVVSDFAMFRLRIRLTKKIRRV